MSASAAANSKNKEGFAHVAQWIALDSDHDTSIYRKFGELSARNLLYLQAELLVLEREIQKIDTEDAKKVAADDVDAKDVASTWERLRDECANLEPEAQQRMDLIMRIREKIKEYHEAILLQNEVAKLRRPSNTTLVAYKHWFQTPHPALGGLSKTFLDEKDDLVGLGNPGEADYLSMLLRRHWPVEKELSRDGIGRFNERSIIAAVAVISTIIAAMLLIGPIVGLYFVKENKSKLGMIAFFTAVFAASVGLITNARRAEIFGATAAYAAVLVVFVSGDLSN